MGNGLSLKEILRRERVSPTRLKMITWTCEKWRAHIDEHAAIYEYDAGMPRRQAEAQALRDAIAMVEADLARAERKYPELKRLRML